VGHRAQAFAARSCSIHAGIEINASPEPALCYSVYSASNCSVHGYASVIQGDWHRQFSLCVSRAQRIRLAVERWFTAAAAVFRHRLFRRERLACAVPHAIDEKAG